MIGNSNSIDTSPLEETFFNCAMIRKLFIDFFKISILNIIIEKIGDITMFV